MSLTGIARYAFAPRQHKLEQHFNEPEALQHNVLQHLLRAAANTEYGRNHLFATTKGYDDFVRNVPVNTYEELKADIDRMRHGEADVLWPGKVKWYAKSSGTTNDKSKFIPVSAEGLKNIHYKGGTDVVALYLQNNPKSRMFDGKGLILGGSHSPNYNVAGSLVGDLSAILIENINPLVNLVRVPKKQTALLSDFEVKRDRIARECLNKNVTNISGVPSWMLSVLVRVLELSGKERLDEVWPNLEVFFHGGIAFTPYRSQYEHIIKSDRMHYMETYNASEGFFGIQNDPEDKSMLLMLDYDVFYEFLPMDEFDSDSPNIVPLVWLCPPQSGPTRRQCAWSLLWSLLSVVAIVRETDLHKIAFAQIWPDIASSFSGTVFKMRFLKAGDIPLMPKLFVLVFFIVFFAVADLYGAV